MSDRWNLITSKEKENIQRPTSKMIIQDEDTKNKEIEKIYERKKRKFDEMQMKKIQSPLRTLESEGPSFKPENLQKFVPERSVSDLKATIDQKIITSKIELMKINSGESIEKYMNIDAKILDLDQTTGGIYPYFVKKQNTNYLIKQKLRFPDIFFNIFMKGPQSQSEENFSFSGLFVPLNIVYFVRDNIIYIWDYFQDEIYTYTGISNVIVNLHITLPKQGIFNSDITFIMIVATVSEVFLILISTDGERRKLILTKSDFVYEMSDIVTSICSTSERRIFLGSQNNYLYELDYTNTFSFFGFSKRAKKITQSAPNILSKFIPNIFNFKKFSFITKLVVDNTRHLLYALNYYTKTENTLFNIDTVVDSVVYIYDLGETGTEFIKLGEIKQEVIKQRYAFNQTQNSIRDDPSFVILDIYPITRLESKIYNLIIVTKNGIRAYLAFDTFYSNKFIKDEEIINEIDKNKINRFRPNMKYSIMLKQIPEPSNATIIEGIECESAIRALQRSFLYKQIYFIDRRYFIFYKDEYKKRSYIDAIEFEDSSSMPMNKVNNFRNKETLSNILKFDLNKELYSMVKLPYTRSAVSEFGLANLLKMIEYENILPRNINFMDSIDHVSFSCMHIFAKQIFLPPEEFLVMTSSELVIISKLRPIDVLFKILNSIESQAGAGNHMRGSNILLPIEINNFINDFGISETIFMLLTIISNKNFVFYRKLEEPLQSENVNVDINSSKILMMDTSEIKNNQRTIDITYTIFINLIEYTIRGFNTNTNVEVKDNDIYKDTLRKDRERDRNVPTKALESNFIGHAAINYNSNNNYITYALYMYLARIARLFWEEKIYLYCTNPNETICDNLKINQIKYLISLLQEYQIKLGEIQEKVLQKASEVNLKIKSIVLSKIEYGNINFVDFSNLNNEYNEVLFILSKFIESLKFVEILYELNSLKKHLLKQPQNTLRDITNLKFKDIILNTNNLIIKHLIEEYFEVALNENDFYLVGSKLDELAELCPNIINQQDKELITANMLIRLSKSKQSDEITKKNLIRKAVNLMNQNPESMKLEKTVKILGELGEVRAIVEVCVKKAIYLKGMLEKDGDRNLSLLNIENTSSNLREKISTISQSDKEVFFNDYKLCLYTILKLLNEIHQTIKWHDQKYISSAPEYLNIKYDKKFSLEEKIALHTSVIEEILKNNVKFLHDLLFDHLKSQDMLDDIIKYNSPYIEPYLSSQIEKEKSNPKRYEALYKFYMNTNNYQGALRILLELINFDNSKLDSDSAVNYVRIDDRRNYAKHLIYAIDFLIEGEQNEDKKNTYLKIRALNVKLIDTYLLQHDIISTLQHKYEKVENKKFESSISQAIKDLDRNYYDLMDLYNHFTKNFKLYEINFQIFFQMFNRDLEIDTKEVRENYENYFNQFAKLENFKWPVTIFPLMNKLFIILLESNTNYDSFSSMLKENNYKNVLNEIVPLNYLINKIEKLNWVYLIKEKNPDFEKLSLSRYDFPENIFWSVIYLRDVVKIPCFYIFNIYNSLMMNADETESFVLSVNLIQIIKLWCTNVEILIDKSEKKDHCISRYLYDDYREFLDKYNFLQEFLKNTYLLYSKTSMKIILDDELRKKIVLFCQTVENKLQWVINYYIKMNKKLVDPLNSNLKLQNDLQVNISEIGLQDKLQSDIFSSKPKFPIKPNILEQCD